MSSPQQPSSDSDRNLLFGVLALQADLIDENQFVEACTIWAARKTSRLSELLVQRGWISDRDRLDVDRLCERKLNKHDNDARVSLLAACDAARNSLSAFTESQAVTGSIRGSTDLPDDNAQMTTGTYEPRSRGRYGLDFVHASGGIGRVWRARDDEIGRAVALKELRPDRVARASNVERFIREARITGQLEHPAIVPVYELKRSAENGLPFYVMRLIRGRTLSQASDEFHHGKERRPVDFRKLLTAFVEVCNAVGYAHARGVVHRDLKGTNVVLGDYGEVIVLDWGLAKVLGKPESGRNESLIRVPEVPDETVEGAVVGTPGYMSPEQAAGRNDQVGPPSDVYGLGAMLYEILTGQAPHTGSDRNEILRKDRDESPPAPRSVGRNASPALEAVCMKALERDPSQRYGSAMDLAAEVERYLADEPVQVWREPLTIRAGRWARRNRPLLAGAAALLVTAVVSLGINNVLLGREQSRTEGEKIRAEKALTLANANFDEMERQRTLAESSALSEKAAREASDIARQRAVKNLRKACDSVDLMLTRVSEDRSLLATEPRMEEIRRRLLEDALKYYKDFLEEYADDVELRRETVRASRRSANILQQLGRDVQASVIYAQAITLCRKLMDEFPNESAYRQELAGLYNSVGVLEQSRGNFKEAAKSFDDALEIKRQQAETYGDDPEIVQEYANSLHNRAKLFRLLGKSEQALESLDKAIKLRSPLAELYPRQATYRLNLGRDMILAGNLLEDAGEGEREERILRQALELHLALLQEFSGMPECRQALGLNRMNLGIRLRKNGNPDDAVVELKESLKIRRSLADDYPSIPAYRSEVARVYGSLGLALLEQKRKADAIAALEEGVKIQKQLADDFPRIPDYRGQLATGQIQLGFVLLRAGETKRADEVFRAGLAVAQKLVEEHPNVPSHRHSLAILCQDVAAVLLEHNNYGEARRFIEQGIQNSTEALAIEPGNYPIRQSYRLQLHSHALVVDMLKDHEALATTATAMQKYFPDEADVAYDAARSLAAASLHVSGDEKLPPEKRREAVGRYSKRAIDSLSLAVKLGFSNRRRLENDSAFDATRKLADFKAVVESIPNGKK